MAFKSVTEKPVKRIRSLGVLKKSKTSDDFYLRVADDCNLVIYDAETKEYFKVLKVPAKIVDDGTVLFQLEVDLEKPQQATFLTKD